jgi:hypothetical protein
LAPLVIISNIRHITDADCTGAGYSGSACVNRNQDVFTHRLNLGNTAIGSSPFGAPPSTDSRGYVSTAQYMTNPATRASGFSNVMTLEQGEMAYLVEVLLPTPDMSFFGSNRIYARSVF